MATLSHAARALRLPTLALTAALLASACMQPPPPPKVAKLKVIAEPANTTVYINDRFVGTARILAKKAKRLKPGVKYITFKAPGHFPHDVRLKLEPGETKVKMKLRPIPQ